MELNNIEKSKKLLHLDSITTWRGFVISVWLHLLTRYIISYFSILYLVMCFRQRIALFWLVHDTSILVCNDSCHKLEGLKDMGCKGLRFACKKSATAWYCLETFDCIHQHSNSSSFTVIEFLPTRVTDALAGICRDVLPMTTKPFLRI